MVSPNIFNLKRKLDGQIVSIQAKNRRLSDVEEIFPPEMVEKILKLLNFKEICRAKVICRRWKEIIDNGNLMQNASGNILNH